ncbi:uncharacterized protein EI90DRAFT_3117164 [Cantharellus anzutake]|uniref:uncharacterized protein n=1 Tax=Cantharellus anzutake TaxID=1750568 RepID=UPI001903449D|nr:uncharacterized protein EI90DRAFT_3117164 [Cantharellus anzutake]KAF8340670.1 hypothetical protein EI90DRAFT_3117164 [Cantharellus anzutake]
MLSPSSESEYESDGWVSRKNMHDELCTRQRAYAEATDKARDEYRKARAAEKRLSLWSEAQFVDNVLRRYTRKMKDLLPSTQDLTTGSPNPGDPFGNHTGLVEMDVRRKAQDHYQKLGTSMFSFAAEEAAARTVVSGLVREFVQSRVRHGPFAVPFEMRQRQTRKGEIKGDSLLHDLPGLAPSRDQASNAVSSERQKTEMKLGRRPRPQRGGETDDDQVDAHINDERQPCYGKYTPSQTRYRTTFVPPPIQPTARGDDKAVERIDDTTIKHATNVHTLTPLPNLLKDPRSAPQNNEGAQQEPHTSSTDCSNCPFFPQAAPDIEQPPNLYPPIAQLSTIIFVTPPTPNSSIKQSEISSKTPAMEKWKKGSSHKPCYVEYGSEVLYSLGAHLNIHPRLVRGGDDPIIVDFSQPRSDALLRKKDRRQWDDETLKDLATYPGVQKLTLLSEKMSKPIRVENHDGVTVEDVLNHLHEIFQQRVSAKTIDKWSKEQKEMVENAYQANVASAPHDVPQRYRHVDMLLSEPLFDGLHSDSEYTKWAMSRPDIAALVGSSPEATKNGVSANIKETYLQLLPRDILVGLVLSLDRDRNATIWPVDLPGAVKTLREIAARKEAAQKSIPEGTSPPNIAHSPIPLLPHLSQTPNASIPPLAHLPQIPPGALPPHAGHMTPHPGLAYPTAGYMMMPYGAPMPPARTARNATGRPPNGPGTGSIPSYEEMIVQALTEISDPQGVQPKVLKLPSSHWPLMTNFRPSASQALQKAFKRGRLQKVGTNYRLNPGWSGGSTSKRTNRRPQRMDEDTAASNPSQSSSANNTSLWNLPTSLPFPYGPPSQPQPGNNPYQPLSRTAATVASSRIPTSQVRPISKEEDQDDTDTHREDERRTSASENVRSAPPQPPSDNFSLRQNLRTLAKLLRESMVSQVKQET